MMSLEVMPYLRSASYIPVREAVDGDGEWQAAVGMELGIEEHLGVPAAIGVEPGEIAEREIPEILFGLEDVGALIAEVEKVLEVGEGGGLADVLHRVERDRDLVAAGELEHLLGLERDLDVEVEFGLGQAADEGGKISHQGNLKGRATEDQKVGAAVAQGRKPRTPGRGGICLITGPTSVGPSGTVAHRRRTRR
jgi:hypothetical protein